MSIYFFKEHTRLMLRILWAWIIFTISDAWFCFPRSFRQEVNREMWEQICAYYRRWIARPHSLRAR